jgi:hypothetical protein
MGQFKRARLSGSDELFRPTRPQAPERQDGGQDVGQDVGQGGGQDGEADGPAAPAGSLEPEARIEGSSKSHPAETAADMLSVGLSVSEVKAIVDALQLARFPERQRTRPTMGEFERLGELQDRLRRLVTE